MRLKGVKVFESGKYPQGTFDINRVKKIFGDAKETLLQFAHTSKIKEANKEAVLLGKMENFSISDDGVVKADIEFNEKGTVYKKDGIINGLSVEIANNVLTGIAALPIGVKPAVAGAEFAEEDTFEVFEELEFEEEIEEEEIEEKKEEETEDGEGEEEIKEEVLEEVKEEPKEEKEFSKSEVEKIKEDLRKEMEFSAQGINLFNELKNEGKITKALEEKGLTSEFCARLNVLANKTSDSLEFNEENTEFASTMLNILKGMHSFKTETTLTNVAKKTDEFESVLEKIRKINK